MRNGVDVLISKLQAALDRNDTAAVQIAIELRSHSVDIGAGASAEAIAYRIASQGQREIERPRRPIGAWSRARAHRCRRLHWRGGLDHFAGGQLAIALAFYRQALRARVLAWAWRLLGR